MIRDNLWLQIRQEIDNIKVVDTHEHLGRDLPIFTPGKKYKMDLLRFLTHSYLYGDLIASGMKLIPRDKVSWQDLSPYLDYVKNTTYYTYLLKALKLLYGLEDDEINDNNWQTISNRIIEKTDNHVSWSLKVLDLMNIHRMFLEISEKCKLNSEIVDDKRLVQVLKIDDLVMGGISVAKKLTNSPINTIDDYLHALDIAFDLAIKSGTIGVKSVLAYIRIISYDKVEKSEAQKIFNKGLRHATPSEMKKFQDFMMHVVCENCAKFKLPFQIHTGLQADNFNDINNSNPTLLVNLIKEYRKVNFVLFHGSFPYSQEAAVLAKYFPNVYLDACWLSDISHFSYKRTLSDWLELVPVNKIFAWGGDQSIIEHSYASLLLAKDLITDILVERINSGYFNLNMALSVMKKILNENAVNLFKL